MEARQQRSTVFCLGILFLVLACCGGCLQYFSVTINMVRLTPAKRLFCVKSPMNSSSTFSSKNDPIRTQNVEIKSTNRTLDYEFVIAHYNEKLGWLRPFANHSHVYHKGQLKAPPFPVMTWEELPNVGREAHTYLHHIVTNYDHLANLTVFLQGHKAGPPACFATPMAFVQNARNKTFCKKKGIFRGWGGVHQMGKWLVALKSGDMRRAYLTPGAFYTALFGTKHPTLVPVCFNGCFSATRDNLRHHPVSFYKRALAFLIDHSNPEEAHYMERLWATIVYG